jgi:outer membrane protein OmpA-like peptidoglycan-associated protein
MKVFPLNKSRLAIAIFVLCLSASSAHSQTQTSKTKTKTTKVINDVGSYGNKVIGKIMELFAMNHKIPKGYVDISPIQMIPMDSATFFSSTLIAKPQFELRLQYPRITPSKGYFSFQLSDNTYFKYVKDIDAKNIEYIKLISDDGRECIIDKYEFIKKNGQKRSFTFLLDHSGSMGDKRASLIQEALYYAIEKNNLIDNISEYSIYKFSDINRLVVNSSNISEIKSHLVPTIGLSGFGGGTAVKDALIKAIDDMVQFNKNEFKLLVLFTDGDSNSDSSQIAMSDVLKKAVENNINIVSIAFGSYLNVDYLRDIAKYSGGNLYHIYKPEEFDVLFDNIFKDVDVSYDLSFVPCNFGSEITLEMKLKSDTSHYVGRTIFRIPFSEGYTIDLNILFDNNNFKISDQYHERLNDLVNIMKNNPALEINIEGHTDKSGNEKANLLLSENRAKSVKEYLVSKGVESTRIQTLGYGSTRPSFEYVDGSNVNPNNRRIQVVISKK